MTFVFNKQKFNRIKKHKNINKKLKTVSKRDINLSIFKNRFKKSLKHFAAFHDSLKSP